MDGDSPLRAPRCRRVLAAGLLLAGVALGTSTELSAQVSIANTVHNLTPSGRGTVKGTQPAGLCVYCHTPHQANPTTGLWNRNLPGVTYQIYASRSLQATVNQPTNSSRLCLSCHDGILALASVRVPKPDASATLGPLRGPSALGTDLHANHPVSFVYDSTLAAKNGELVDPGALPKGMRVDADRQLQCTSCHDPHESRYPHFLRTDTSNGTLCTTCHRLNRWTTSIHATSQATWSGGSASPFAPGSPSTVAANACGSCHRTHSAAHAEGLLAQSAEPDNCTVCHAGNMDGKNIAGEFSSGAKLSRHPIEGAQWTHAPNETPATMTRHVSCADCHNPHAAVSASGYLGSPPGPLFGAVGVDLSGSRVSPATAEYQVCIKCHDPREPTTPGPARVESTRSVRVKINPGNASFHPIAAAGRNPGMKGLLAGYTASSIISCGDCHNNSDAAPKGGHASRFAPILERNYVATDLTPESPVSYDLCYKCHDRSAVVNDGAQTFPHRIHVASSQASCAVCHDAHGARANSHLINFMTRDASGRAVVTPNRVGRIDYVASGPGKGSCYLKCHGYDHNPANY